MRTGINGWTFERGTPLLEAARRSVETDFAVFEPTLEAEGELSLGSDEAACRRLGEGLRSSGLEVSSLACGLFWEASYTSPDPEVRQRAWDWTVAALDRASWLGVDVLLVVPGMVSHPRRPREIVTGYARALQLAYENFRTLAFEAEARNVILAIENVWNQFLLSPVEMREFIDHVNSSWVQCYFDVGNVVKFGFPQDWIDTLGRRIARVHVKDFKLDAATGVNNVSGGTRFIEDRANLLVDSPAGGDKEQQQVASILENAPPATLCSPPPAAGFCLPGDGDVDWPAVLAALRRTGYDGPLIYEGKADPADVASRLKRILAAS